MKPFHKVYFQCFINLVCVVVFHQSFWYYCLLFSWNKCMEVTNAKGFKSCLISMKLTKTIRPAFKVEVPNLKWALKYLAQKSLVH